jgi:NAD(P)-dependent dehydrogenase (short-subunit alcohol dehydrogenase family)
MDIQGSAAIVTGGASGLGGATVERLARGGAKVAIFDLNEQLGHQKAEAVGGLFFKVDVTDEDSAASALAEAEAAHGIARICVNCAGIAPPSRTVSREGVALPLADFRKVIDINLIGTFNVLSKFAARLMNAEPLGDDGERGVIINTSSVSAFEGQIGQAAYSASKGGVASMSLPIAREFSRKGIRVLAIAPGIFWTPLMEGLPKDAQESLGQQVPFPSRMGKPEEYAMLVESIVTNVMLNGEIIRLDGAIRMAPR